MLVEAITSFFNLIRLIEARHITKTNFEETQLGAEEVPKTQNAHMPQIPRIDESADLQDIMYLLFRRVVILLYGRKLSKTLPPLIAVTEYFLCQKSIFIDDSCTESGDTTVGESVFPDPKMVTACHASKSSCILQPANAKPKHGTASSKNRSSKLSSQSYSQQQEMAQALGSGNPKQCSERAHNECDLDAWESQLPSPSTACIAMSSMCMKSGVELKSKGSKSTTRYEHKRVKSPETRKTTKLTTRSVVGPTNNSNAIRPGSVCHLPVLLPQDSQHTFDSHTPHSRGKAGRATTFKSTPIAQLSVSGAGFKPLYKNLLFDQKTPIWGVIYYCWSLIDAIFLLHGLTREFAETFSVLFEENQDDYCTYIKKKLRHSPELLHAYRRNVNLTEESKGTSEQDISFYHLFFVFRDPMYFTRNYRCSLILQHAALIAGSSSDFLATLSYISEKLSVCVRTLCDTSDPVVQHAICKLEASCTDADGLLHRPPLYASMTTEIALIDSRTYLSWLGLLGTSYTNIINIRTYQTLLGPYIQATTPTRCCLSNLLNIVLMSKRRCILPPSLRFHKNYHYRSVNASARVHPDVAPPAVIMPIHSAAPIREPSPKRRPQPPDLSSIDPRLVDSSTIVCPRQDRAAPQTPDRSDSSRSVSVGIPWSTLFDKKDECDATFASESSCSSISLLSTQAACMDEHSESQPDTHMVATPVPTRNVDYVIPIPRYNIQLPSAPRFNGKFVPQSLVNFKLVERVNKRCSRGGSNPGPLACEANVIANYTTRACLVAKIIKCAIYSFLTMGLGVRVPERSIDVRTRHACTKLQPPM